MYFVKLLFLIRDRKSLKVVPLSLPEPISGSRPKRSEVWNYFHRAGESEVVCEICLKTLGGSGALGTSNMKRHLKNVHGHKIRNVNKDRHKKVEDTEKIFIE